MPLFCLRTSFPAVFTGHLIPFPEGNQDVIRKNVRFYDQCDNIAGTARGRFMESRIVRSRAIWYKTAKKRGELKKELIHSRKITVNCYETDEDVLAIR
jgi:hypothetical protein